MAYNPNQPQAKYVATAGQTVFNYLFKVFLNTDLVVYQVADGDDPELAVPLTLDIDYTVTINGDDGGSIELTSGAVADDSITIYRGLSLTRYVEYQQSGDLLANTLNNDQDYQTYLIADLKDHIEEFLSGEQPGAERTYVHKAGDTMTGQLKGITPAEDDAIPLATAGTYTPTITPSSNVASAIIGNTRYSRVENVVTVSGTVFITPSVADTVTRVYLSLPIPTSLSLNRELNGTLCAIPLGGSVESGVVSTGANDTASLRYISTSTSQGDFSYIYQYEVI